MKKKSVKMACDGFLATVASIKAFAAGHADAQATWAHEYAIIWLYRAFEHLILEALVGAVNNDTRTLAARTGVAFPRHLTDEVCEYLIVGDAYFDFKGRDGLIRTVHDFVADGHYLLAALKDPKYRPALERLCAFRNYAAHASGRAKAQAKKAVNQVKLTSAGAWLAKQGRFDRICDRLSELAAEIKQGAPY